MVDWSCGEISVSGKLIPANAKDPVDTQVVWCRGHKTARLTRVLLPAACTCAPCRLLCNVNLVMNS